MTEDLSAWMDGELRGEQAHLLPSQIKCNAKLRADWSYYYLIGDVLRGMTSHDLYQRICTRLAAETNVFARTTK